jgi:hypothetical protein
VGVHQRLLKHLLIKESTCIKLEWTHSTIAE